MPEAKRSCFQLPTHEASLQMRVRGCQRCDMFVFILTLAMARTKFSVKWQE